MYKIGLDAHLDDNSAACGSHVHRDYHDNDVSTDIIPEYDGYGDEIEQIKQEWIAKRACMRVPYNQISQKSDINSNASCMSQVGTDATMLPKNQNLQQTFQSSSQNCVNQTGFSVFSNRNEWNTYECSSGDQQLEANMPGMQTCVTSYSQQQKFIHSPGSMQQSSPVGSMQQSSPIGNHFGFHGSQSTLMPIYDDTTNQRSHEQFHIQRYPNNQQVNSNLSHAFSPNHSVCYISPRSQGQGSPLLQSQLSPMSYSGISDYHVFHPNQHQISPPSLLQPISPPAMHQPFQQAQFLANPLNRYGMMPADSTEEQTLHSQRTLISGQHINGSFLQAGSYIVDEPDSRSPECTALLQASDYQTKKSLRLNFNPQFAVNTSVVVPSQLHINQEHINLSYVQSEPHNVAMTSSFGNLANICGMQERFQELLNSPNSTDESCLITQPDVNANTFIKYHSSSHPNYCEEVTNYHNVSFSDPSKEFHEIELASSFESQNTSVERHFFKMQQENFSKLVSPASVDFNRNDILSQSSAEVQGPSSTSQLISTDQPVESFVGPITGFTRNLAKYEQISPPSTPSSQLNHKNLSTHSLDKQFSLLQELSIDPAVIVNCEKPSSEMQKSLSKNSLSSLSSYGSEYIVNRSKNQLASCEISKACQLKAEDISSNGFQTRFLSSSSEQYSLNGYQEDKHGLHENQSLSLTKDSQGICAELSSHSGCAYNFENSLDNSNGNNSLLSLFSDDYNVSNVSEGEKANMHGNAACSNVPAFNRTQLDVNSGSLSHLEHFVGSVRQESEFGALFDICETVLEKNLVQNFAAHQQHFQNPPHLSQMYPHHQLLQQQQQLEWNTVALRQPESYTQSQGLNVNLDNSCASKNFDASEKKRKPCVRKSQSTNCETIVAGVPFQKKKRGRPRKNAQMYVDEKCPFKTRKQEDSTSCVNDFLFEPTQQHFYSSQGSFQQLLADDTSELLAEFSKESDLMQNINFTQQYDCHENALLQQTDCHPLLQQTDCHPLRQNTQHNAVLPQPPPQLYQHKQLQHEITIETLPSPDFCLSQAMQINDPFSNFDTINPEALLSDNPSPQFHDHLQASSEEKFDVTTTSFAQHNDDKMVDHEDVANTSNAPSDTDVDKMSDCVLNTSSVLESIWYKQKLPKFSPAYTYRFEVPTSLFKRLKVQVKNVSDTKLHPSNVRMRPQDARKYSLLKIGKEIIRLENLSDNKIKDIQDNLKAGLPLATTPSSRQVCVSKTYVESTTCAHIFADYHSKENLIKTSQIGAGLNTASLKSSISQVPPAKDDGQNVHTFMNTHQKHDISKVKRLNSLFSGKKLTNIRHLKKFKTGFPFFGKGYVCSTNVKMKQKHPTLGYEYNNDEKIVKKEVDLIDTSEEILVSIKGKTPMADCSPAHGGEILSDVESQIPVLLKTNHNDLEHDFSMNKSSNSHMFEEEVLTNKEIWKHCNKGKESDGAFGIDLEIENKHNSVAADKFCQKSCQKSFFNEFERYIELKHLEQNQQMKGLEVDIFGSNVKSEESLTHFEDLLQKDLLERVETDKESESNDFVLRNTINLVKQTEKHSDKRVSISSSFFQNDVDEVKNDNIILTRKVEYLEEYNSNSCDYQISNGSSIQESSKFVSGDGFVVNRDTDIAKRQQSTESQSTDSSIKPGKHCNSQSSSLSSNLPGSRNSSRSSSSDTDGRKNDSKPKGSHKRSCRPDSNGIPGLDNNVINKYKGKKELRVMVDRLVVSDRELHVHKLEQVDKKYNGIKRKNSDCVLFKKMLPNSVSLNVEPNLKATGFSAEFEKFLASQSWECEQSDSNSEDCNIY